MVNLSKSLGALQAPIILPYGLHRRLLLGTRHYDLILLLRETICYLRIYLFYTIPVYSSTELHGDIDMKKQAGSRVVVLNMQIRRYNRRNWAVYDGQRKTLSSSRLS